MTSLVTLAAAVSECSPWSAVQVKVAVAVLSSVQEKIGSLQLCSPAGRVSVLWQTEQDLSSVLPSSVMAQGLKLLSLEGVEPTPETIREERYPLLNPKYVVIPADAAEDAPNRILYNWLLGEEGQRLVAQEGYVSVLEVEP